MKAVNFEHEYPDHQPHILAIAAGIQKLVLSIFPTAVITLDDENVGYGFGRGYKDLVFVITPYSKHVNLGIVSGAALADPVGLMQGKGQIHRHVKLRKIEMVSDPDLADLMGRALEAAQMRIQRDA